MNPSKGMEAAEAEIDHLRSSNAALKAENESLAPTNLGDAVLIAALRAENEALKKGLAHWKGWAENEREENQDWAKRLRSRAEAAEKTLASMTKERDEARRRVEALENCL